MFCRNCGNEVKEGERFCENCGSLQDESSKKPVSSSTLQGSTLSMITKKKEILFILIAFVILVVVIASVIIFRNSSDESSITNNSEVVTELSDDDYPIYDDYEIVTESSRYQKSNSYNIPCNGNNEVAIEAANVFADKYGASNHDWTLISVDASVIGMGGTYRYSYNWAGSGYTATTDFTITDYGEYRNYSWSGDYIDLFYGN